MRTGIMISLMAMSLNSYATDCSDAKQKLASSVRGALVKQSARDGFSCTYRLREIDGIVKDMECKGEYSVKTWNRKVEACQADIDCVANIGWSLY